MIELDLTGIKFSHTSCLWCRNLPPERLATEGCSTARLIAEVERLRHGVNHPYGGIVGCDRCAEVPA